ncbi:MAG: FtsW/RodA/SpoVE family cell cycle protein [bacterium]|nr:FtsW/RodA/SpoVE family cell cycle protein [bacterium]
MSEDKRILILVIVLVLSGLFILFNASSFMASQMKSCHNDPFHYVKKQIVGILIGGAFLYFLYIFKLEYLKKLALPLIIISLFLLILVLAVGKQINGARRWIDLGITNFQPSEMAEFSLLIYISAFISSYKSFNKSHAKIIGLLVLSFLIILLIAIEPNVSTAILVFFFVISLLAISDIPRGYVITMGAAALFTIPVFILKYSHAMARIRMLFGSSSSEQCENSILAVANGGLLGEGIGMGKFKLFFIPEVHSDFIFTTIAEEMGFIGSMILISLFILFLKMGIDVAKSSYNSFHKALAYGVSIMIFTKAIVHIAISLKLAPATGLVLPFISYGGSAMIFNLGMVGILMNIARENRIVR